MTRVARRPRPDDARHMFELVRETVPPVHPAGLPFISAGLALALAGRNVRWLRRTGLLAAGACAA